MLNGRFGLGFIFSAKDLASAKMKSLEQRFETLDDKVTGGTERMTGAFKQLGIGLAVFTAGAVAVAGAFALAGAAGKFEQGLAAVGAVTRATTDQLRSLRDAAIQAGIQTQFSPDEAVAGLQSLATAGQTAEQATRTLVPVLDLAAGSLGQLGVASAAEAVVGTLNAYGMAAGQAAGVTDKLLRITQLTNFQTRDFEAGLAKAAAAGSVFGQNLDDVLITMGLLRNRNIDASSSATAFREATRRVGASSRAQQAIQGAGVAVFDKATGRMRSMVDIMTDFARATSCMGEAERNRRVVQAFGARGLLAFNAVLNASFTTMRDGRQVTLQGAEAIAALRKEMQGAGGTAAGFREKLLDTFEGQKTLLSGTLQTLAIGLGEPFAQALKPVVGAVTGALNAVIRVITAMPAGLKRFIAGVVTAAGAFVALVGAAIMVKALFVIGGVVIAAFGAALLAAAKVALVLAAVFAAVVAAVTVFRLAWERDLGGIATFFRGVFAKVSLIFSAIRQLFADGGFSGAVQKDLAKAENSGVKAFAIKVFMIARRIGAYFEGLAGAIGRAFDFVGKVLAPAIKALSGVGDVIGDVLKLLGITEATVVGSSGVWKTLGTIAGTALGMIVRVLGGAFSLVIGGLIAGLRVIVTAVRGVVAVFRMLWDNLALMVGIVGALLTGNWAKAWLGAKTMVFNVLKTIILIASGFVELIASMVDQVAGLFGADLGAAKAVRTLRSDLEGTLASKLGVEGVAKVETTTKPGPLASQPLAPAPAAVAQVAATREMLTTTSEVAAARDRDRPIQVNATLEVEGETIARVSHAASRNDAARAFSPVPSY